MKTKNVVVLNFKFLRAWWRFCWAESRADAAQQSVEVYRQLHEEALALAAVAEQDLAAARGAMNLAHDALQHHQVCSGLGLR